jgi:hypothetical protein
MLNRRKGEINSVLVRSFIRRDMDVCGLIYWQDIPRIYNEATDQDGLYFSFSICHLLRI